MFLVMIKTIKIEFCNPLINIYQAIDDIIDAIKNASYNLYSRHGVKILKPILYTNEAVIIILNIPEYFEKTFLVGRHLKGVSEYLLKQCDGRYNQYIVGTRLMKYTELPNMYFENLGSISDMFEMFSDADKNYIFELLSRIIKHNDTLSHATMLINQKQDWTVKQKVTAISILSILTEDTI